jgi:hypothetical protein
MFETYPVYLDFREGIDFTNREIIINYERLKEYGLLGALKFHEIVILDYFYDRIVRHEGFGLPYFVKDDDNNKVFYRITQTEILKHNPIIGKVNIGVKLHKLESLGLIERHYHREYEGWFYYLTPKGRSLVEFTIEKTN